jgi:hypothetical protein
MMGDNRSETLFRLLSFAALLAAGYHLAGVLGYFPDSRAPIWRHMLFVDIDIAASIYFIYRPIWALPLFVVLTVQQSWSHGNALYRRWENQLDVDWLSLATLIGLYVGLALLAFDAKRRLSYSNVRQRTFSTPERNSRKPIITGTSRRASVSDTSVWQLDVLPSVEAYCGATRTECVLFLDKDVSPMISLASSPTICASASVSKAASKGAASQTPLETKWCNWS